jgi:hypothetical protein
MHIANRLTLLFPFLFRYTSNKMGNVLSAPGGTKMPLSPFELMWREKRERAKSSAYIQGQASDFYFLCRNGKIDEVRQAIDAENAPSLSQLNELQPNGSTALHAATYYEHRDIVKLLFDRDCPRTELNRFGHTAYEETRSPEMKQLFERPDSTGRFHELDTGHTIAVYLPEENDRDPAATETQDFVQIFKTDTEIFQHSLNKQTTAMWLKFYNWFSHTFRVLIERDDFHINQFDLNNHGDFQQFLRDNLSDPIRYQITIRSINEAQRRKSIEPLITLYTNERAGFYRPFNHQLAGSSNDAANNPHLCDRFILEFYIHRRELKQRAFTGTVYRGATLRAADLTVYERARFSDPPGVLGLKAFTSTSTDPLVALRFATKNQPTDDQKNVLFVFEILKATSTIFGIEDVSQFTQEHEVLILPGNLFVVKNIQEDLGLKVTTIYLRHWHVPVSFWAKMKQTFRAGKKSAF